MYIVTRTFRDANGVFSVGSVVEPTDVKAFKSRVQQRHIVNVDEQNIEKWATFFINRFGIDLADILDGAATTVSQDEVQPEVAHDVATEEASEEITEKTVEEAHEKSTSEVEEVSEEVTEDGNSEGIEETTEVIGEPQHMDSENESW